MSDAVAKILIVDDVPTNVHILGDTLASDYRLHIAMNGPQALQLAEQILPDLILLDVMMPGMDGFEVLRRLRANEALAEVPVIFVTALESPGDESSGLQLGAADYITKPFNPELVKLRVKNHLEMARQRAALKEQKQELESRNQVLKKALDQIKRLEGIIPICMCCKKIRDDQDSWQLLENYLTEHSDALFSHGLCPHCAEQQLAVAAGFGAGDPAAAPHASGHSLPVGAEQLRALCDRSPVGMFVADRQGRNTYCNPRMEQITGQSAEENLRLGWGNAIHPEDRAEALLHYGELSASGRPDCFECRLQPPRGGTIRVRVRSAPILDQFGTVTGFVGTVEDITRLFQARGDEIQIQKLESLGLLASGIAHDFNNLLTGILGNISLAQGLLDDFSQAHPALHEAEKASERAVVLSRQLLTLARSGQPVKKAVSVKDLVAESVSLGLRGSNIQGVNRVPVGIAAVDVDEQQMVHGISNLFINAAKAMPEGGRLAVEAEEVGLHAQNLQGLPAGKYVKIGIAGEGSALPENAGGKTVDSRFSGELAGACPGLNATCSIVAGHGGHLGVSFSPDKGTVFTLHLPSLGAPSPAAGAALLAPAVGRHQGGTVLVMDDEQMIRTIAEKMLECLGFQVTTCENGSEAVSLYAAARAAGAPFEAVIMDLTVAGGMGGKDAARHILAGDPGARLVVSSGYSNDPVLANFRDHGFCAVLPKPYKASDLSMVLSKVLQEGAR